MKRSIAQQIAESQAAADAERRIGSSLKAQLSLVTKERDKLIQQLRLIEQFNGQKVVKPEWLKPPKKAREHHATANLLITDTHFDEIVDPDEIDGINAYNREIAELRLQRTTERTIMLTRDYLGGVKYDGLSLMLGGDIFSGNIHEELARTNADTLFGSLLHWLGPMVTTIGTLADEFKRVYVSGVPGNHGRMTRKPIFKKRASDNLDWLFYMLLQREFKSDSRVTWNIPNSADAHVQLYNSKFLLTHGDQFSGGGGIAGALSPLMLGSHRKTRREMAVNRPYDCMVIGHWHQYLALPSKGLIVGPCMKGYDEYAFGHNFEVEPAQQALWIVTPEHGTTFATTVYCADRKVEGW